MKWDNKGHQYDLIGKRICDVHKQQLPCYIWGAGTFGISFWELFHEEIFIEGFVDSDVSKQGKRICGIPVYKPQILQEKKVFVLVSAGWTNDIYRQLETYGYVKGRDYLHIDDFSSLYQWYKNQKVYLSDITFQITEKCSLKCKNCNAFIPIIQNPVNISVANILDQFEKFFRYVDKVNVLGIVGGDAMMHPQFNEIIEALGEKYYPHRAAHLEVYCNAVIVPSEQTLEILKKFNVFYRFSDYRPYTEERQKIEEIVDLLQKYEIRYDHVKFEKWCDCGYPQKSNGLEGEEQLIHFFDSCDRKSCHVLFDRYLLNCGMARNADRIGYCHLENTDYFDIADYNQSRKIELLEYMLGYSEKGYLTYCKMCNGSFNVNKHMIEAGEQIGKEK